MPIRLYAVRIIFMTLVAMFMYIVIPACSGPVSVLIGACSLVFMEMNQEEMTRESIHVVMFGFVLFFSLVALQLYLASQGIDTRHDLILAYGS